MTTQKHDAIIFGLFGIVVDNFPRMAFARFLSELAGVMNIPSQEFIDLWNEALWPRRVHSEFATLEKTVSSVCQHFSVPVDDKRIAQAVRMRYEYTRLALVPRHDAVETLTVLKNAGYKLGLIGDCTLEMPQFSPTPLLVEESLFKMG